MTKCKSLYTGISFVVIALGIAACSPSPNQRFEHEGPKKWTPQKQDGESLGAENSALPEELLKSMEKSLSGISVEKAKEFVGQLSPFVLNRNYLENPAHRGNIFDRALHIFNRSLLKLLQVEGSRKSQEVLDLVNKYVIVAMGDSARKI